jgi:hypothetical protein
LLWNSGPYFSSLQTHLLVVQIVVTNIQIIHQHWTEKSFLFFTPTISMHWNKLHTIFYKIFLVLLIFNIFFTLPPTESVFSVEQKIYQTWNNKIYWQLTCWEDMSITTAVQGGVKKFLLKHGQVKHVTSVFIHSPKKWDVTEYTKNGKTALLHYANKILFRIIKSNLSGTKNMKRQWKMED